MVPDLRSIAPAVASADGATGVPDGGSCYANTLNSGPTWAASQANLRDHALRLSKRRGDIACAEVATANAKLATVNNLSIVFSPDFLPHALLRVAPLCRTLTERHPKTKLLAADIEAHFCSRVWSE